VFSKSSYQIVILLWKLWIWGKNLKEICFEFCLFEILLFNRHKRNQKWKEYYYQSLVNSDFVIRVKEPFLENDFFCIEMDYANGGSLSELIKYYYQKKDLLPYKDLWIIFVLILKGLNGLAAMCSFFFSLFLFFFKIFTRKILFMEI
jgi:serine/threonine protein kinase